MKTQIVQLSQNEDHISVRDKMSACQAGRILLVWPEQGGVLNRRLDLQLVVRHADHMGAQLALASIDPDVNFYAHELGISIFSNSRQALDAEWQNHRQTRLMIRNQPRQAMLDELSRSLQVKNTSWVDQPAVKAFCLAISMVALFALGIFILPGAKIILTPQVQEQVMVFDLVADPHISSINYSTGSLPTYSQEVIVEGRDMLDATGSVSMADMAATGTLRFSNYSDQAVTIPVGTIVSTEGANAVRFITTVKEDISLDPDTSANLPARAILPGPTGNLGRNELVVLEGITEPDVSVTNPRATSGGTERLVPSPSALDLASLKARLTGNLIQEVTQELNSLLPEQDFLITPTITNTDIMTETVFPGVGNPGNRLELTLRLRVHVQVISAETLNAFVNPMMDAYTPASYAAVLNSVEITPVGNPVQTRDGKTYLRINVSRKLQAVISDQRVAEMVKGKTIPQAGQILTSTWPISGRADFMLSPGWWPRLPFLSMRIDIAQAGIQ